MPIPSSARIATPSSAWSATRRSDSAPSSRAGFPGSKTPSIAPRQSAGRQLSGDEAFKLYDTFGLPLDFIEDLAGERQVGVDRAAFERAMEGQREKARAKSAFEGKKGQEFVFESDQSQQGLSAAGDRFEGYTTTTVKGTPVIALFDKERRQVKELQRRSRRLRGAGADAVLCRVGRPGVRCRLPAR